MITLYHARSARSFRALWMLEELGLEYRLETVAFPPRVREPGFLDVNPLGTVPVVFDEGVRMTESAAICHYLATQHGDGSLVVAPHQQGYADYLNFLIMGEATLTFPQTIYLRYSRLEPEERRLPQAAADYAQWFASRLRAASGLIDGPYAAAGRFTAADVSLGYAIKLANLIGLEDCVPERMQDYWCGLQERPGLQRAEAKDEARS